MTEYIKYLYLLDDKFPFKAYTDRKVLIDIKWGDSFNPDKAQDSFKILKYEISCIQYNLGICKLRYGIYLFSKRKYNEIGDIFA